MYAEKIESRDLFSKWVIEDPYYLNDSAMTDWRDASLSLNKEGTFELHKPPNIIFKKLSIEPNTENKIIGHWTCDGSHVIFYVSGGTEKTIIKKTNLVTPDNARYKKGIKILWPLDDNSNGGIIWMKQSVSVQRLADEAKTHGS